MNGVRSEVEMLKQLFQYGLEERQLFICEMHSEAGEYCKQHKNDVSVQIHDEAELRSIFRLATKMEKIEIDSKGVYPACVLANEVAHPFVLDGVKCESMESFLQALKYRNQAEQIEICETDGENARALGDKKMGWKIFKTVWWKGTAYGVFSDDLQVLIDRAYMALYSQNEDFQEALRDMGRAEINYETGEFDMRDAVLTEYNFVRRLERLRELARK